MVVALSQCLVHQFDQQIDRGYKLPHPAAWVVRDNKWRATRYGLDADVITDDHGSTAPMRDVLYELQRELEPVAERLGCAEELAVMTDVLEQGSSCERQRAILADGGTLEDIVDATLIELAEDRFVTSNPNRGSGHSSA
jgi:carboxylate-amine ligase